MDPLALHDPAARDLWIGLIIGWVAGELALHGARSARQSPLSDWTYPVVVVAGGGGIAAAHRLAHLGVLGGGWVAVAAGTAVFSAGVALRTWSIITLGRFFTSRVAIQPGQRVVRAGPYRVLRHPSYAGMLAALLGLGVLLDSWPAVLVIVLLPLAGLLVRIRVEERTLEDALGEEYRRYAAETSRLVPRIW
jgi:protein-S-isoprenylcysteine O-methyltransferase Ste14